MNKFVSDNLFGGILVKDMRPLTKNVARHGLTKIGLPSFYGFYGGKKVKLYGVIDKAQVDIRRAIKMLHGGLLLPNIIATEGRFIVQEWIEGTIGTELRDKDLDRLNRLFHQYFKNQFTAPDQKLNFCQEMEFDYLSYLEKRLSPWLFINEIKIFREYSLNLYVKWKKIIPGRIHHSDLTLANIVLHHKSDEFYIIDNELLNFGPGWILDYYNSNFSMSNNSIWLDVYKKYSEFIDITWALRKVGSRLLNGNLKSAIEICQLALRKTDPLINGH